MLLKDLVAKAFNISKTEASKMIESGAIRINDVQYKNKFSEVYYIDSKWIIVDKNK